MTKAQQFRMNALKCFEQARAEASLEKKTLLLRTGESWLALASNEDWLNGTVSPGRSPPVMRPPAQAA